MTGVGMREGSLHRAQAQLAAARAARRRIDLELHSSEIERLEIEIEALPPGHDRSVLSWAAVAERLRDIGYVAHDDTDLRKAAHTARQVLSAAGRARPDISARLRLALGHAAARLHAPGWLPEATQHFVAAGRLFLEAGEPDEAASAMSTLAWSVQLGAGQLRAAHASLTEGLSLCESPAFQASLLSQRAQLHLWLGELDRAQSDLETAWSLAQRGDDRSIAYVAWAAATLASLRGQRGVVESWVQRGDAHRAGWADANVTGLWYEAAVVEALARVGAVDAARRRLADLLPYREREPTAVGLAEVSFQARWGDSSAAAVAWEAVRDRPDLEPWDAARLRLLVAAACERSGIPAGPGAAEAFDLCAGLEQPAVLLTIEPAVARALLPQAARAGSTVAARLLAGWTGWRVRTLGGFAVHGPDGEPVTLTGRSKRLVMYLAVNRDPVSRDHLARWLWPDAGDDAWRRERLRRVLHRTRALLPDAVESLESDRLRLSAAVTVDLRNFTDAVRDARAAQDSILRVARAREALSHVRGELLPDEVLDDDWLIHARMQLARDATWVHTVMAEHEAAHGHEDAALGHARAALAAEATNETAAALAAGVLRQLGRRGEALKVLQAAEAALAELDLQPGPLLQAARMRLESRGGRGGSS